MQIEGYVQALRDDLARVAAVGDESTARAAELLAVALESSFGRRLQEALGEAALELSSQLDTGRIEVRIAGGDPELVLVQDRRRARASPPTRRSRPGSRSGCPRASRRTSKPPQPEGRLRQHVARAHAPQRCRAAQPSAVAVAAASPATAGAKELVMSDILIRASIPGDARWSYDDPSGVTETPLSVQSPRRCAAASSAPRPARASRRANGWSPSSPAACSRSRRWSDRWPSTASIRPTPVELDVQIPVGDIQVETTDGDESVVSVTGNEKLVENTTVELQGDRLIVALKSKKPFGITISIGDFSFGTGGLHVNVRIPHASSATLATAAADMKLKGRYEQLEVKSASGDLTVTGDIQADATIKSVSGDVRVGRSAASCACKRSPATFSPAPSTARSSRRRSQAT